MSGENMYQDLLVDAICGIGFPSVVLATECQKVGLAVFTGSQNNPEWLWRRSMLEKISSEKLEELYQGLWEAREEARPVPVEDDTPQIILQ